MKSLHAALLLASVLATRASSAGAQTLVTGTVVLHWHAPEASCPSVATAGARLATLLVDARGAETTDAQVAIARTPSGGWRATLATQTARASGARTLESASCREAADAVLVMIALSVDTTDVAAPPPPRVPRPARVATRLVFLDAEPPPPLNLAGARPRRAPGRVRVLAAVGVALDVGSLPRLAPGLVAAAGVRWAGAELEVTATLMGAQSTAQGGVGDADISLAAIGLRGCRDVVGELVVLRACGLAEAGPMLGTQGSAAGSGLWGGLAGGPMVAWNVDARFELRATLDAGLTLLYPRFLGAANVTLFEPSRFYARGGLALAVRF